MSEAHAQFRTDVAIRCHEVGIGPETSDESVLRQVDEVVARWHEAERRARDYDMLNGRLIIAESQSFGYRDRIDRLENAVVALEMQVKMLRQPSMTQTPNTTF